MDKRERMYERIRKHGEDLLLIFPHAAPRDPVALCKRLRQIEVKAHAHALRLCDGPEYAGGEAEAISKKLLHKVHTVLQFARDSVPVFVNQDPRGYALKIESEWTDENAPRMYKDWGGYGIIAPNLSEE